MVFHYWDDLQGPIANMNVVASQFDTIVASQLPPIVVDDMTFENIKVRDVFGLNQDFEMTPTVLVGAIATEPMPGNVAVRVDLNVTTKETRRGMKRVPGIAEDSVIDEDISAAALAAFQTWANTLGTDLIDGTDVYHPVVYGGPTTLQPLRNVTNFITGATVRSVPVTQNTRRKKNN